MRALVVVVVAMLAMTSCRSCEKRAPPVAVLEEIAVDVREGSGVAVLGAGQFLVLHDEIGVQLVDAAHTPARARVLVAIADLEGLTRVGDPAADASAAQFIAIEEQSGLLWSFDLAGTTTRLGYLMHPASSQKAHENRGWEGLALLPARLASDHKDHLIAVHEGSPKAVALFAWPSLEPERTFIPSPFPDPALDKMLDDLSDVAVDDKTGELLLLSDKSRRIVRVKLALTDPLTMTLVRATELPVGKGEKPEGIAYDAKGDLWIVTDVSGRLLRIAAP